MEDMYKRPFAISYILFPASFVNKHHRTDNQGICFTYLPDRSDVLKNRIDVRPILIPCQDWT